MFCSLFLCNSPAKVCPGPLLWKPVKAPPTCSHAVSAGVPGPPPNTRLPKVPGVFQLSRYPEAPEAAHSPLLPPFWASGGPRQNQAWNRLSPWESHSPPPTSPVCRLILAELPSRASVSLAEGWIVSETENGAQQWPVPTRVPRHRCDQFGLLCHHQSGDRVRLGSVTVPTAAVTPSFSLQNSTSG